MSSRTLSWQQIVQEADPDWAYQSQRPVVYRFSNGRTFRRPADIYSGYDFGLVSEAGAGLVGKDGSPLLYG